MPSVARPTPLSSGLGASIGEKHAPIQILPDELVPSLSFIQGFIAGQALLLFLFLCLFRYCFMTSTPGTRTQRKADMIQRTNALRAAMDAHGPPRMFDRVPYEQGLGACVQDMLDQVDYDLAHHAPESVGWLNVLVAQLLMSYRTSILRAGACIPHKDDDDEPALPSTASAEKAAAKQLFERILNEAMQGRTMNLVDTLTVTDIDIGCRYPRFSHARVRPSKHALGTLIELDFEYIDALTLGIDTRLWLHFPHWRFASLAAAMCVRVDRFAGTLGIEVGMAPAPTPIEARISLHPDFVLDAHVSSVFGSKSKLQDVPKIEDLFLSRIRSWLQHHLVWPNAWHVPLPGLGTSAGDAPFSSQDANICV